MKRKVQGKKKNSCQKKGQKSFVLSGKFFDNEQFLNKIFDSIQVGICVIDSDFNIIRSNKCKIDAFHEKKTISVQKCYAACHGEKIPCSWCPAVKTFETGQVHVSIVPYPSLENLHMWLEVASHPLKDENGKVTGAIEFIQDITHKKYMEDILKLQNDLSGNLGGMRDLNKALNDILDVALKLEGVDSGEIYLLDEDTKGLHLIAHKGLSKCFVANVSFYEADDLNTQMLMEGKSIFCSSSLKLKQTEELRLKEGLLAIEVIPVWYKNSIIGVFNLASKTRSFIPEKSKQAIEILTASALI